MYSLANILKIQQVEEQLVVAQQEEVQQVVVQLVEVVLLLQEEVEVLLLLVAEVHQVVELQKEEVVEVLVMNLLVDQMALQQHHLLQKVSRQRI